MKVKDLRDKAEEIGIDHTNKVKADVLSLLLERVSNNCMMKIPALKKAKSLSLHTLHDRI